MGRYKIIKKNWCFLLLFTACLGNALAQNNKEKLLLDIDGDKVTDTISSFRDSLGLQLQCHLSSQKKRVKTPFLNFVSQDFYLTQIKNTFSITFQNNRSVDEYIFEFNRSTKQLQLIVYKSENFGSASQEGSGKKFIDLKLGKLSASRLTLNSKTNKMIPVKRNKKIQIAPIYFENFNDGCIEKLNQLY
jgi:hypothetical protein